MARVLTSADKKFLRGVAHDFDVLLQIGKKGLTDAILAEINAKLQEHALIKIKISVEKENRKDFEKKLLEKVNCEIVGSVGGVLILYRDGIKPLSASAYQSQAVTKK